MPSSAEQLLIQHHIQPTANRILVLNALLAATSPRTMAELEAELETIDKSSIFRVLCLFRDHKLVHVIEGAGGASCYEPCHSHDHEHDSDRHVHFLCEQCGRVFCLHHVKPSDVSVPEGFKALEVSCVVHGLCAECARQGTRKPA